MQTSSVATGLIPGTHAIIVNDIGANNTYTATTYISPLVPLTGSVPNPLQLDCFGSTSGTAAIQNLSGGSGNSYYVWTNGTTTQTNAIASGIGMGTYTVNVTDALTACQLTQTFSVVQPPALTLNVIPSATAACTNTNILITPLIAGGTPNYSYSWTAGPQTGTYLTTQAAGGTHVYTLTAFDSKNCAITKTVSVDFIPGPVISVSSVSICPTAAGTLIASGAITYTWSDNSTGNLFAATPTASSVYTVTGSGTLCATTQTAAMVIIAIPTPTIGSNTPVCNGQTLQLSAGGGTSYHWNGPLAYNSAQQQPVINSASPANSGVYNLTVTAANSCTAATSVTVLVNPTPPLTVTGSTVCVDQNITLTSSSTFTNLIFSWAGPASFTSNLQNPVIPTPSVSQSGDYTLTVTDPNGCINSGIAQVTVSALPVVSFAVGSYYCENAPMVFNAAATSGATTFSWSGPNGFSSFLQNPVIQTASVGNTGVYTLVATHGPCTASNTRSVTVTPLPSATAQVNNPLCETNSMSLTVNVSAGVNAFQWTGPVNFLKYGQHVRRDSCIISYSGIYTASVTDNYGCSNTATIAAVIYTNPVIFAPPVTVCLRERAVIKAAGAATYTWNAPGFQFNGDSLVIASATNTKTLVYTVTGLSENGCKAVTTTSVDTRPLPAPTATILPGTTLCVNNQFTVNVSGGERWLLWGPNDLHLEGKTIHFTATSDLASGIYTVVALDHAGCAGMLDTALKVNPLPDGVLKGNMSGCVPLCADYGLSRTNASSVVATWSTAKKSWSGENFSNCFQVAGIHTVTGHFTDTVTGCKNTIDFFISVFPKPVADFSYSPDVPTENGDPVVFTNMSVGDELEKFSWYFINNSGYSSHSINASYLFETEGNYPVVLVTSNKWGCKDTIIKSIHVDPDFTVFVPNIFTPNKDEHNDVFIPVVRGVSVANLSIFDRWGAKLFQTSKTGEGWDGTYMDEDCKNDVYIWKIVLRSIHGELKQLNGHVTISR
jgi:gliding motility-associated-like protein